MRYVNPKDYDYVDPFVPLDLNFMNSAIQATQKSTDLALANIEELGAKALVQGGRRTTDRAKAFNKKTQELINAEADKILGDPNYANKAAYNIKKLREQTYTNPEYLDIIQDEKMTPEVDKLVLTQGFQNYVQDFFDPNKKQFNQTKEGERFNSSWYGSVAPGDPQKEFKDYYSQFKDIITQGYDGVLSEQANSDGSISIIQNGTKIVRTINKDELRQVANHLLKSDPNFGTLQSFNYAKAVHDRDFGKSWVDEEGNTQTGSVFDTNDKADIFVDNYLGNKHEESDLQRIVGTRKAASNGGTGSGRDDDGSDNIIYKTLINADANNGKTKTGNLGTMAGLLGGEIVEITNPDTKVTSQAINVDFTDRNVVITPSSVSQTGTENMDAALGVLKNHNAYKEEKAAFDKTKANSLVKDIGVGVSVPVPINVFHPATLDDAEDDNHLDRRGNTRQKPNPLDYNSNYIEAYREKYGISKQVPLYLKHTGHVFIGNQVAVDGKSSFDLLPKSLQTEIIKHHGTIPKAGSSLDVPGGDPDYVIDAHLEDADKAELHKAAVNKTLSGFTKQESELKAKYKTLGYDPDDKRTAANVKKYESTDLNKYLELNQKLNLTGEHVIKPNMAIDNVFVDKNHNIYGNARVVLTGAELDEKGINVSDFKNIIIPLQSEEYISWGNDDEVQYSVPITLQSQGSIDDITRNTQIKTYGPDKETEEGITNKVNQTNTYILQNKGKRLVKDVYSQYQTPEGSKKILTDLNTIISELPDDKKTKYTGLINKISTLKDKKEQATEIAQLYLLVSNPNAYGLLYGNTAVQQTVGKTNPQGQQDPLGVKSR